MLVVHSVSVVLLKVIELLDATARGLKNTKKLN